MTREGLTADLEAMKAAGIGGAIFLEVDLGLPRGPVAFMSTEWQELFAHAVSEAARLGIEIALGTGPGWCGSGGPWVPPEHTMQHLVASETHVTGPAHVDVPLPRPRPRTPFFGVETLTPVTQQQWQAFYHDVAVLAFPAPATDARLPLADEKALYLRAPYSSMPGVRSCLPPPTAYDRSAPGAAIPREAIVDLTHCMSPDGCLHWDVPPGTWTVLRFGRTVTGQITRPAPAPGLGFETDKFETTAIDAHLDAYLEPLLRRLPRRARRAHCGLTTLHLDSWEMSAQNWSSSFAAEFRRRRGYDLCPFLPAYTGRIVESVELTERFLWDVRQTAQELIVEHHIGRIKARAHAHGLLYSNEPYDMNPTNDLELGAAADVPMAEFWWYGFDTTYSVIEAASLAHTGGHAVVAAEAFTSMPGEDWRGFPAALKPLGDWAFAAGINRLAFHRYQHQPWLDRWPGLRMGSFGVHWERTQTWWPMVHAYHTYLSRCHLLLRQGQAVADILYLTPEDAPCVFRPPASAVVGTPPNHREYAFDACAPGMLIAHATVQDGRIVFPGGANYRVLVLPETGAMTPRLLHALRRLLHAGATIVGAPPHISPSLSGYPHCDDEIRQLATELWQGDGPRVIWDERFRKEAVPASPFPLHDALWIAAHSSAATSSAPAPAPVAFVRSVDLPLCTSVASARIFICARGRYELFVNGQLIATHHQPDTVHTYNLGPRFHAPHNVIRVVVSPDGANDGHPAIIAALELQLHNGSLVRVTTDQSWLLDGSSHAVQVLAPCDGAPWPRPTIAPYEQHAEPLYPSYMPVVELLAEQGVLPDFTADAPLRFAHRTHESAEIYFVSNCIDTAVAATCWFRVTDRQPELWHPVSGSRRVLPDYTCENGRTAVPLQFAPHESYFIIFRRPARPVTRRAKNFPSLTPLLSVDGSWSVSFGNAWTQPFEHIFECLHDWTQHPSEAVRFYSGIATYRTTFVLSEDSPALARRRRTMLDLGDVRHLARVRLNGHDLGVVWCAPWHVATTGTLQPGVNQLEIEVANLWINRLIHDAALPEEQRRTWTSCNPFSRETPLVPSGLLGPVRLLSVAR